MHTLPAPYRLPDTFCEKTGIGIPVLILLLALGSGFASPATASITGSSGAVSLAHVNDLGFGSFQGDFLERTDRGGLGTGQEIWVFQERANMLVNLGSGAPLTARNYTVGKSFGFGQDYAFAEPSLGLNRISDGDRINSYLVYARKDHGTPATSWQISSLSFDGDIVAVLPTNAMTGQDLNQSNTQGGAPTRLMLGYGSGDPDDRPPGTGQVNYNGQNMTLEEQANNVDWFRLDAANRISFQLAAGSSGPQKGDIFRIITFSSVVPEPATLQVMLGLTALLALRRTGNLRAVKANRGGKKKPALA